MKSKIHEIASIKADELPGPVYLDYTNDPMVQPMHTVIIKDLRTITKCGVYFEQLPMSRLMLYNVPVRDLNLKVCIDDFSTFHSVLYLYKFVIDDPNTDHMFQKYLLLTYIDYDVGEDVNNTLSHFPRELWHMIRDIIIESEVSVIKS